MRLLLQRRMGTGYLLLTDEAIFLYLPLSSLCTTKALGYSSLKNLCPQNKSVILSPSMFFQIVVIINQIRPKSAGEVLPG